MTYDLGPWGKLPPEMRARAQWAIAGADKAPQALGADGKLRYVSVTRPGEWMTFEQAVAAAWMNADVVTTHVTREGVTVTKRGFDLGYILHEEDPFTCIDLDIKDAETHPNKPAVWTPHSEWDRYLNIVKAFSSFTERSRSGKGLHIWVMGNIGRGYKRDGVEVYSQERFIICTGNVFIDEPLQDREQTLLNMVSQMRKEQRDKGEKFQLVEHDPREDDWYVFQVAATAANSDKFWRLWRGQWTEEFKSQSEADLALMSMFTFYSDSNAQCRRLFRDSALGKREKATKNDRYIDDTLRTIRARQEREANVDFSEITKALELRTALQAAVQEAQGGVPPVPVQTDMLAPPLPREVQPLQAPGQGDPPQAPPPPDVALAQMAPVSAAAVHAGETGLPWPPGFVGTVARFIYANSYLPIKEVSIVSALGLMAGLCGKAWHIPQSGLNLYVVLVARSAIGKEAMHHGISTLVSACQPHCPQFGNFVDFTEYASGPALVKACLQSPSFVNVSGEWGRRMKRMAAEDGRDGALMTLRTQMTNLYQKSGPTSIAGGMGYSSAENNVASVQGVAYSLIGETTPSTFYDSLTEAMMEDGFLSRFLIIAYDGDRPDKNPCIVEQPDDALRDALVTIAQQANNLIGQNKPMPIGRTEAAANVMAAFDAEAESNIRGTDDESRRQMWNRASLKALRLAGLLAVGQNYASPVILPEHMEWAIDVVRRDIAMMRKRLEGGDVGSGDTARERKLMSIIRDYLVAKKVPPSYKVPAKMHENSIVPRSYLQMRTQQASAFYNHKLGSTRALEEALSACIAQGYLMEVKHDKVVEDYGHHGKAYRILDVPDYEARSKK